MHHKNWLIVMVGLISVAAGLFYTGNGWFSYSFMGPEQGSEAGTVAFWGKCSMALGAVLLLTLALRSRMKTSINDGQLIMLLSCLFVIQLPPFGLWMMALLLGGSEGIAGLGVHAALLLFISLTFVTGKRRLAAGH